MISINYSNESAKRMNKVPCSLAVAAVLAVGLPTVASAQFSLPSIPGVTKGGSAAPAAELGAEQDGLVRSYVAANKDVLTANSKMAEALGLKQEAAKLQETSDALTQGSTKDNLDSANTAITTSTDAVAAEMAKKPVLDAQSKAIFGAGLLSLVSGVNKYVGVGKNVKDMGTHLSGASPLQLPKLQSAVFIVSKFPTSMSSVSTALSTAIDFAKNQGIEVPGDATAALANVKGL